MKDSAAAAARNILMPNIIFPSDTALSPQVADSICHDGFGQVQLVGQSLELYNSVASAVFNKLNPSRAFASVERMSSPFGGCYGLGGEQTGGAADPRAGCYIFDPVEDRASPLANATQPDFQLAAAWRALAHNLTHYLTAAICGALGNSATCLDATISPRPYAQVLISRYPSFPANETTRNITGVDGKAVSLDLSWGISEHRDYGYFAFIAQLQQAGLEVQRRNGDWVAVPAAKGMLTFIAGHTLELLTDGFCRAVPHRVRRQTADRYSTTTFVNPALAADIRRGVVCNATTRNCYADAVVCNNSDAAGTARCGASGGLPTQPFCWEDYEVYTYCRMFSHLPLPDGCAMVMQQQTTDYRAMRFRGRPSCSRWAALGGAAVSLAGARASAA